jgi:glycerate kinase
MSKPLTVLSAPDSFKGALSSEEAGNAVRRGILKRLPDTRVKVFPVGDGGEGTADALMAALHAEKRKIAVSDTHGAPAEAEYGVFLKDGLRRAVFDMASAAGIRFARSHGLDLPRSTTRGVGELIRSALSEGCGEIVVGLGGSGTCDGGIGALYALGARFADKHGKEIEDPRAEDLGRIASVDLTAARELLGDVTLTLLYDSGVPLTGEQGAVLLYARQKGAKEEDLPGMESAMKRYASVCDTETGCRYSDRPGAGAAGGLGYGLSLAGGNLVPGASYVLDTVGFRAAAADADLVITGEGRTDVQTATGKLPLIAARIAKEENPAVKTVCLCGIHDAPDTLYRDGIDAVFALADRPMTAEDSMEKTADLLEKAAFDLAGIIRSNL